MGSTKGGRNDCNPAFISTLSDSSKKIYRWGILCKAGDGIARGGSGPVMASPALQGICRLAAIRSIFCNRGAWFNRWAVSRMEACCAGAGGSIDVREFATTEWGAIQIIATALNSQPPLFLFRRH